MSGLSFAQYEHNSAIPVFFFQRDEDYLRGIYCCKDLLSSSCTTAVYPRSSGYLFCVHRQIHTACINEAFWCREI